MYNSGSISWSERNLSLQERWTQKRSCLRRWMILQKAGSEMHQSENPARGQVTIRELNKSYRLNNDWLSVLRQVNLDVRGGESVAIVGASGSGKTTLLRVIAGLEEGDSGEVLIDGSPI